MAFPAEILRSGVGIAHTQTIGVQCLVSHEAWTGQDVFGTETYAAAVSRLCVVDRTNRIAFRNGQQISIAATLTFVGDVPANGAAGRREPFDVRDRITLPDGFTGPIIDAPGAVTDPSTSRGFIQVVTLGSR